MLPTFLVIGAMKSGTTSLHGYLSAHPQVFVSERKELHYFSVASNLARGRPWYESNFADAGEAVAVGEVSPSYSQADIFPGVAERIAELIPEVRLVYLVRHPIERLQSMYLHLRASGREDLPIARAVTENAFYLNASRYAWQLDQHLEYIPAHRVKVVTAEALRDRRAETLAEVFKFLDVEPDAVAAANVWRGSTGDKRLDHPMKHRVARLPGYATLKHVVPRRLRTALRTATSRPIDPALADLPVALESELADELRPDVARLRPFIGDHFDGWGLLAEI